MKCKILFLVFVVVLLIIPVFAQEGEKRYIIKFKDQVGVTKASTHVNIDVKKQISPNIKVAELTRNEVEKLQQREDVDFIEEDFKVQAFSQIIPWNIKELDVDLIHESSVKGEGTKIAVFDTGVDYYHEDLVGAYSGGYDFVNSDSNPMDDSGHGTFVSGVIFAQDNGFGLLGIAPESELYALKVLDSEGMGYTSDIILALQWSIDNNIDIVSMSLGGADYSSSLEDAVNDAYGNNILLIAAVGNSPDESYPASYSSVIAVSAADKFNQLAYFSRFGPEVEFTAPGVDILSTSLNGYAIGEGTSFSAPHVSGIAALVWSANEDPTNNEVRQTMQDNALDLGLAGFDTYYGYGLVRYNFEFVNPRLDDIEARLEILEQQEVDSRISELEEWKNTVDSILSVLESRVTTIRQWLYFDSYESLCSVIDTECSSLESGCTSDDDCSSDRECLGGDCILRAGCDYGNPSCDAGYECMDNECVPIQQSGDVIFRTPNTNLQYARWIMYEGEGYGKGNGGSSTSRCGAWCGNEGLDLSSIQEDSCLKVKNDDCVTIYVQSGKCYYTKYCKSDRDASQAITTTTPTEPYKSNGQEVYG